jgi:hypothetical protein
MDIGIIDQDDELNAAGGGLRNERISKTIAEEEGSCGKRGPSFKRNRTIVDENNDEENASEEQLDPLDD